MNNQTKITIAILTIGLALALTGLLGENKSLSFDRDRLERIGAHYQAAIDNQEVAGARAVILQNGRTVYDESWGYRDLATKAPLGDDTIYHIYSMTKPITSVAVMMLFEEGKFLLHEPIAKYIPELADLKVYDAVNGRGNPPVRKAARQPTIRDVLTHTAGFTYGFFDPTPLGAMYRKAGIGGPTKDLQSFVENLGKLPLKFDPGAKWNYSVSTDVLGRLVEVVSGQTFGAFLQTRIFGPLGMKDTSFTFDPTKAERQAVLYSREGVPAAFPKAGFLAKPTGPGLEPAHESLLLGYTNKGVFESGGAGLLSTVPDYLRFAKMLLNDGELDGTRILSPNSVHMMRRDHVGDTKPVARVTSTMLNDGIGFGLGFGTITDQGLSGLALPKGSYFWGGAAGTFFWVDPANDLIGLFMTQVVPHRTTLRQDMWGLTYQAISDKRLND